MKTRRLINWLCLSGICSGVFYLLHDIIGARYYPGYEWMKQAVSDLTSVTAPSFVIASGLSSGYGLFACLCCSLVCIVAQGKGNRIFRVSVYLFAVMNWISGVRYSLFPLSESGYAGKFQDFMHLYVITALVVILSAASLVLIIAGCLKTPKNKPLALCAIAALTIMLMGAIGVNTAPSEYFGVVERFSTYSAVVFNAILGLYAFAGFRNMEANAQ